MVNFPIALKVPGTKVDDLDVLSWKPLLKIGKNDVNDVVSKEVVKKTLYKRLNEKKNNLENKIPDASRFIQTNLYNTGKQHLNKKFGELENKILMLVV